MRRRGFALLLVALMVLVVAGTASAKSDGDGCGKFDSDVIGVEGVSLTVDGVTVTLTDWVAKDGEPNEFIGFTMAVDGGAFDMAYVKAGNELLDLAGTSGTWMNGEDKVKAVSHVQFCDAVIDDGGGGDNPDGGVGGVTDDFWLEG